MKKTVNKTLQRICCFETKPIICLSYNNTAVSFLACNLCLLGTVLGFFLSRAVSLPSPALFFTGVQKTGWQAGGLSKCWECWVALACWAAGPRWRCVLCSWASCRDNRNMFLCYQDIDSWRAIVLCDNSKVWGTVWVNWDQLAPQ